MYYCCFQSREVLCWLPVSYLLGFMFIFLITKGLVHFGLICNIHQPELNRGGWTLISNLSGSAVSPWTASLTRPLNDLLEGKENIFLSTAALKEFWDLTKFTQIRWKCYKKNVDRVLDIATSTRSSGLNALNFFLGNTDVQPNATQDSFVRLPDDRSRIAATPGAQWGYSPTQSPTGKWGDYNSAQNVRLFDHPFYKTNSYHWLVSKQRMDCDDFMQNGHPAVTDNDYWQIYVR